MGGNTTTCGNVDGDDDDLLEDVLIQILVWLPVISLLRFKSVCKSWRALIETPFFTHLHTSTTFNSSSSLSSSKFGSFIFYSNCNEMYMLSSRSESVFGDGGDEDDIINNDRLDYLGFPPCSDESVQVSLFAIRMVGSCNGLICLDEPRLRGVVSLWNPATRQFRYLPKLITTEHRGYMYSLLDFVIFGFDVKTKDYKVVYFRCFLKPNVPERYFSQIQVYSLSTDSWRLLEGIHDLPAKPYNSPFLNHGINMNGCHFFAGKDESQVWLDNGRKTVVSNSNLIYSFDFTKEILTTIQSPDHDSRHDFILTLLGEKMALFIVQGNLFSPVNGAHEFHDCGLDYEYYHIWVLNNAQPGSNCAGVDVVNKVSWTKLYSFRKLNLFRHLSLPRGILNNGEFALISSKSSSGGNVLQLFNLVTGEAIKDFPFGKHIIRADTYRPSLVSIIGGNDNSNNNSR